MDAAESEQRSNTRAIPGTSIERHHCITWQEVPALMDAINLNRCEASQQVVLCFKLGLMTFLRAGTLVRLRWEWFEDDLLTIPGGTWGLKRTEKTRHLPHHVPLTDEMKRVLARVGELNGTSGYLFQPLMSTTKHPHMDQSAPNNFLRNLGYKDRLRMHGWRKMPLTAGQEVLKATPEIIQRQMGHLIGDKVRKAYDMSLLLDERRAFLEVWCKDLVKQGLQVEMHNPMA